MFGEILKVFLLFLATNPKQFSIIGEITKLSEQRLLQVELLPIIELAIMYIGTMRWIMLKA